MIVLGFTGTRSGMSAYQRQNFIDRITETPPDEFHHGDCIGSDQEAHDLIRQYCPNTKIVIHPPVDNRLRAYCKGDEWREPQTHFARNRNIVNASTGLIATPWSTTIQTGGTWYTYMYAIKKKVPALMLMRMPPESPFTEQQPA